MIAKLIMQKVSSDALKFSQPYYGFGSWSYVIAPDLDRWLPTWWQTRDESMWEQISYAWLLMWSLSLGLLRFIFVNPQDYMDSLSMENHQTYM